MFLNQKFFRVKYLGYLNRIKYFFTFRFLRPLHKPPHDGFRYTPFAMEQLLLNGESSDIFIYALGGWNVSLGQMNDLWLKGSPLFTKQKYITVHYFAMKRTL